MKIKAAIPAAIVLLLAIIYTMPLIDGLLYDKDCWLRWALYIQHNGLLHVYDIDVNYPPLYPYLLWMFGRLAGSAQAITANINYLRLFPFSFDLLGLWYVCKWIDRPKAWPLLIVCSVLNIGYSYNTLIWGQTDGIYSSLVFLSVYYAWRNNMLWSMVFFILACNFKLQAAVILPVPGLLYIGNIMHSTGRWKKAGLAIGAAGIAQLLILLPFIAAGKVHDVYDKVISHGSVGLFPFLTMGAASCWNFMGNLTPGTGSDAGKCLMSLSYRDTGLLLFCFMSALTLLPLSLQLLKRRGAKGVAIQQDRRIILMSCGLIYLLFFFCNTQMHERYCHAAFIFITAYAFFTRDLVSYGIFSVAYLLNLERCQQSLHLNYNTLIFDFRFIAALFLLVIVYMLVQLYRLHGKLMRDEHMSGVQEAAGRKLIF